MSEWHTGDIGPVALTHLGEHYRRYRLPDPEAEADMVRSLDRYGQLAPLVVPSNESPVRSPIGVTLSQYIPGARVGMLKPVTSTSYSL